MSHVYVIFYMYISIIIYCLQKIYTFNLISYIVISCMSIYVPEGRYNSFLLFSLTYFGAWANIIYLNPSYSDDECHMVT